MSWSDCANPIGNRLDFNRIDSNATNNAIIRGIKIWANRATDREICSLFDRNERKTSLDEQCNSMPHRSTGQANVLKEALNLSIPSICTLSPILSQNSHIIRFIAMERFWSSTMSFTIHLHSFDSLDAHSVHTHCVETRRAESMEPRI